MELVAFVGEGGEMDALMTPLFSVRAPNPTRRRGGRRNMPRGKARLYLRTEKGCVRWSAI